MTTEPVKKNLHDLAKEMLNKANIEVLKETGKLKEEPVLEEDVNDAIKLAKKLKGDPAKDGIAAAKKDDKDPAPFDGDEKKSTDWTSAKSKAKNLARAAMKKMADKKKTVNEDDVTELSKETLGSYEKKAKQNMHNIASRPEGEARKSVKKFKNRARGIVKARQKMNETTDVGDRASEETKRRKEALGKGKKQPYLPFGKKLDRHSAAKPKLTETEVNELSKETLTSYRDKVHSDIAKQHNAGRHSKVFSRLQGTAKASMRLSGVTPKTLNSMKRKLASET